MKILSVMISLARAALILTQRENISRWDVFISTGLFFYGENTMASFRYRTEDEVIHAALCIMESKVASGEPYTSPDLVKRYFQLRLGNKEHEIFCVMFLDNQNHLIHTEDMFRGTIDGANVYPREVVKAALRCNAAAVILSHNHPSGKAEPSHADKMITTRLQEALDLVGVRIIDHIIVSPVETLSFAERGLI